MKAAEETNLACVDEGRRVLEIEAAALLKLSHNMPKDFERFLEVVNEIDGRVVVSALGKSGHIARKIAATLSSTGTPAFFLHAAEASHGDLGMIDKNDICLLISNSGETTELRHIVAHAKRFSIPLAAISSRPDSTLMRAADFRLALPDVPEACAIGMAPTTSTTLALAMGDALAVSLMSQRGFQPDDFHTLHPGGRLGAQMVRVRDLMHTEDSIPLVDSGTEMSDVLLTMTSKGFGIAGVVKDGLLAGVITDGDLRRNMVDLMKYQAGDIATTEPVTVTPECFAAKALALMNDRKISTLMVVSEGNEPIGVLHVHDLLRAGIA